MKFRRHHNNKGLRQIKRGRMTRQVQCMAARLGILYLSGAERRSPNNPEAPRQDDHDEQER